MIVREKWPELVAGLRETIINRASVESDNELQEEPAEVQERRRKIRSCLSDMDELQFNPLMNDEEFWRVAATKPFYAGHQSAAVQRRHNYMLDNYLGDRASLCSADWDNGGSLYKKFLNDEGCYRHPGNLQTVVKAAGRIGTLKFHRPKRQIFHLIIGEELLDYTSTTSLRKFHAKMTGQLRFGEVTTFHLMTELGLPVVKPDRALVRTAIRLGLIDKYKVNATTYQLSTKISTKEATELGENRDFCWALQDVFREISDQTTVPMRSLDFIISKMGQDPDEPSGFVRTICDLNPLCPICSAKELCAYVRSKH